MRNLWYPNKRAEYMTAARFAEMGLHHSGTYERDPFFGVSIASDEGEQGEEADEAEEERRRVQVQTVAVRPPNFPVPPSAISFSWCRSIYHRGKSADQAAFV